MAQRVVDRLNRLNKTVVVLAVAAAVAAGLLLPGGAGAVLLLLVALGLAVLLRATWHRHDPTRRSARLLILAVVLVFAAVKLAT